MIVIGRTHVPMLVHYEYISITSGSGVSVTNGMAYVSGEERLSHYTTNIERCYYCPKSFLD